MYRAHTGSLLLHGIVDGPGAGNMFACSGANGMILQKVPALAVCAHIPTTLDGINLSFILGPIEIGASLAALFLGCAVVQAYGYYEDFQKDHWTIKALVFSELLLQTAHVASMCDVAYTMTVTNYGQPTTLSMLPRSSDITILLGPFIAFGVQVMCR
ncbi:hypothetical protein BS17DRAFT_189663 [Gyrodon lividus]|nr:hypothetical protein BS17DRAFT_189663 [Gyrodon lividus]